VGTPAFLPPEIAKGGKARGKPSDVWSLGVCLFYIVCGQLPFSGETLEHITTAGGPGSRVKCKSRLTQGEAPKRQSK